MKLKDTRSGEKYKAKQSKASISILLDLIHKKTANTNDHIVLPFITRNILKKETCSTRCISTMRSDRSYATNVFAVENKEMLINLLQLTAMERETISHFWWLFT